MTTLMYNGKKHLPLPKGPYAVGCTDIMTGNSTKGTFIRLYYPCSGGGTLENCEKWPLWAPKKHYIEGLASASIVPSFITVRMLDKYCGGVHIPAIFDAAPISEKRPLPVVVFSHGLFAYRNMNSTTHVELASHGYIVAAVEHRDQSACYTYYIESSLSMPESATQKEHLIVTDKCEDAIAILHNSSQDLTRYTDNVEEIPVPPGTISLSRKYATHRNRQVHQRAEECSRALDLLRDINEGIAPRNVLETNFDLKKFQGLFDMCRVALSGHSFGGATVLMGLATDPRFKIGLTLDPWTIPLEMETRLPSRLTQPILFIKSKNFYDGKGLKCLKTLKSSEVERQFFTIRGTTHVSQCDFPLMVPSIISTFAWGTIKGDMLTHMDIHNKLIMTFLSKHLDMPVNAEHESYISSMSSLIQTDSEVADKSERYLFVMFLLPCLFIGVFASFIYWLRKEETLSK